METTPLPPSLLTLLLPPHPPPPSPLLLPLPPRCRRVQLALIRSLFLLQDGHELTRNKTQRDRIFTHLLLRGKEVPLSRTNRGAVVRTFKEGQLSVVNITEEWSSQRERLGAGKSLGVWLNGRLPIHIMSNTVSRLCTASY